MLSVKQKLWFKKNRKRLLVYKSAWYQKNKFRLDCVNKEWAAKHPKRRSEIRIRSAKKCALVANRRKRLRLKADPAYRVAEYMRTRVRQALINLGVVKTKTTFKLVGCSPQKLKQYIESLFKSGMTWENYGHGGWVIDHIKPCVRFDLKIASQQRECFHYTNLQPLWFLENARKGDSYVD